MRDPKSRQDSFYKWRIPYLDVCLWKCSGRGEKEGARVFRKAERAGTQCPEAEMKSQSIRHNKTEHWALLWTQVGRFDKRRK